MNASSLPLFYTEIVAAAGQEIILNEETSRHLSQVLRMQAGEQIELTNGEGVNILAELTVSNKRNSVVRVLERNIAEQTERKIIIGISPLKNAGRFEWFLEKATELGIYAIQPLICKRTEKTYFRAERFRNILVSAMLQSRQYFLPHLLEPIKPDQLNTDSASCCLIAHCGEGEKKNLSGMVLPKSGHIYMLIGPEGDFTEEETQILIGKGFQPVSLGNTRLRTETAGVVSAALLALSQ
jgi:16S rRNA (uracil1498-N3)-methyltransferase